MRLLLLAVAVAFATTIPASAQFYYGPAPIVVVKNGKPKYYDPYYNQPKYRAPVYYETVEKTKKGKKTTTKTTIKNQNGQVVYKNKTTKKKK